MKKVIFPNLFSNLYFYYYTIAILSMLLVIILGVLLIIFELWFFSSFLQAIFYNIFQFTIFVFAPFLAQIYTLLLSIIILQHLIFIFSLPFVYYFVICFLKISKKQVLVSWPSIIVILLSLLVPVYFMPFLIQHNFEAEREIKQYQDSHPQELKILFNDIFDQALTCNPDLINDQSLFDDKYRWDETKSHENQCRKQIQQTIFSTLKDFQQLHNYQSAYFVRLIDKDTIQALGLSGKIYQVYRPKSSSERINSPIHQHSVRQNFEALFLILEGKSQFWFMQKESWKELLYSINKGNLHRNDGINFLGYGRRELVVPLSENCDVQGAIILIQ